MLQLACDRSELNRKMACAHAHVQRHPIFNLWDYAAGPKPQAKFEPWFEHNLPNHHEKKIARILVYAPNTARGKSCDIAIASHPGGVLLNAIPVRQGCPMFQFPGSPE